MHNISQLRTLIQQFQQNHLKINAAEDDRLQFSIKSGWNKEFNLNKSCNQTNNRQSYDFQQTNQIDYDHIVNLLFSDNPNEHSLDLQLLDTMFFQQDNSINYIYKDSKKGLVKTKQRGIIICDMFIKRKWRSKPYDKKETLSRTKTQSNFFIQQKQKGGNSLGYICLLRYKDGSFIRLKQYDLRSIFTNPLYANEKFKYNNCTRYIQYLSQEGAQEWKIHYSWQKYKDQDLFKLAFDCLLNSLVMQKRQDIKSQLLNNHPLVYLYFIVFEICAFITIRHNKRILNGIFSFVKDNQNWSLSNVQSAQIFSLPFKQFSRINLWSNSKKVKFTQIFSKLKEQQVVNNSSEDKTQLQKQIQMYFQATNSKITKDMLQFVQNKMQNIKRPKDKLLSKAIFQILHPGHKQNLFDLLDSQDHLQKIINPKQKKLVKLNKKYNNFMFEPLKNEVKKEIKKKQVKPVFIYKGIQTK